MMNATFYFNLKLVLKIFTFFPDFFGYVGKLLNKKGKVNFKIYDVASWSTNNYNKHIARYLKM